VSEGVEKLALAYWRHHRASEDAARVDKGLQGPLDVSLPLLVVVVEQLADPADEHDAASAAKQWLDAHRIEGIGILSELATSSPHWGRVLLVVAAFGPKANQQWADLQKAASRFRSEDEAFAGRDPDDVREAIFHAHWIRRDSGERWVAKLDSASDDERMAAAWCLYHATDWASIEAFEAKDLPAAEAWDVILELARFARDEELTLLGAGEAENVIDKHGDGLIERIERDAHADPRVRQMLCGVWQTWEMSDALWTRIDALLTDYRPEDREGRGQSPGLRRLRDKGIWQGVPFPGGKERIASLFGEAKTHFNDEEIARHVGLTVAEVRAEIDAGTLVGSSSVEYSAPLVAILARFFPEIRRDV
jgi:hypothetical protein